MRERIHTIIRKKLSGTTKRPRLAVYRSLTNLHAQVIDDSKGKTLFGATSIKEKGNLMEKSKIVGKTIGELAKEHKITEMVFDRGGFRYHGAVKNICETVREQGIKI